MNLLFVEKLVAFALVWPYSFLLREVVKVEVMSETGGIDSHNIMNSC